MKSLALNMINKPNILVAGASGGVANAFLHHLSDYRALFNKVILLDKNDDSTTCILYSVTS